MGVATITGDVDYSNEYDNYFVLRGAIYASKNFSYEMETSGRTYPAVIMKEIEHSVSPDIPGEKITQGELTEYGIWKK